MKFLLLTCCALLISLCGCDSKPISDQWQIKPGDHLPDFSLTSVDGKTVTLDSLKGKRAVISLFATWCEPCQQELQSLQTNVWEPNENSGKIAVIAVNAAEDPDVVKKYLERHNITFPILMDPDQSVSRSLGGNFLPRSVVIDAKGRVVALNAGFGNDSLNDIKQQLRLD
jgi:peroxiredoxin